MPDFKFSQELNEANIKKFVNNGDKISAKQMQEFIAICTARQVDPFLKEIYIQGYGNNYNFYIGKDGTLLRARRIPDYAGHEIGWFLADGTRVIDPIEIGGNKIAGAWCNVYIKDFKVPINASCLLSEYAPTQLRATWKSHTAMMIAKCAIVAAHRNAYPEAFGGLYAKEELDKVRGDGDGEAGVAVAMTAEAKARAEISDERKQEFIDRLLATEEVEKLDLILAEFMAVSSDVEYSKNHIGVGMTISWEEPVNVPSEAMFHVLKAYRAQYQKFVMSRLFLMDLKADMTSGNKAGVIAKFLDDDAKPVMNPMISMHRAMVFPALCKWMDDNEIEPTVIELVKGVFGEGKKTTEDAKEPVATSEGEVLN